MPLLFVMIGVSGSGKTVYSQKLRDEMLIRKQSDTQYNIRIISPDNIIPSPHDKISNFLKNNEDLKLAYSNLDVMLSNGVDVIFDAPNLAKEDRQTIIEIGRRHKAYIIAVIMNTTLTESCKRNSLREEPVPIRIIWRQQGRYMRPNYKEVDKCIDVIQ